MKRVRSIISICNMSFCRKCNSWIFVKTVTWKTRQFGWISTQQKALHLQRNLHEIFPKDCITLVYTYSEIMQWRIWCSVHWLSPHFHLSEMQPWIPLLKKGAVMGSSWLHGTYGTCVFALKCNPIHPSTLHISACVKFNRIYLTWNGSRSLSLPPGLSLIAHKTLCFQASGGLLLPRL